MCSACGSPVLRLSIYRRLMLSPLVVFWEGVLRSSLVNSFVRVVSSVLFTIKTSTTRLLAACFYPQYTALITKTTKYLSIVFINSSEPAV